ncbi:hypothetical protein COLO4_35025 [Corchorus olitorius]|uniref:Uncharacterized protein n=1 Tax=Corchorus olitorius TaxID=93759 RepID=A0A1R3GIG7_9ROSI|nr:hypothetical protein COLO4_35025 [Corchorus olitorius]
MNQGEEAKIGKKVIKLVLLSLDIRFYIPHRERKPKATRRGRVHHSSLLLGSSSVAHALHYSTGLAHPTQS